MNGTIENSINIVRAIVIIALCLCLAVGIMEMHYIRQEKKE